MKPEDFVRGLKVAFDQLCVGKWYFDQYNDLFTVVGKSQFSDELFVDWQKYGAGFFTADIPAVYEAVEKPAVEYRRTSMSFYFCDYWHGDKLLVTDPNRPERAKVQLKASAVIEVGSDGSVRIVKEGEAR